MLFQKIAGICLSIYLCIYLVAVSRDLLVVASTSGDVITAIIAGDCYGRVATCRIAYELTLCNVAADSVA